MTIKAKLLAGLAVFLDRWRPRFYLGIFGRAEVRIGADTKSPTQAPTGSEIGLCTAAHSEPPPQRGQR